VGLRKASAAFLKKSRKKLFLIRARSGVEPVAKSNKSFFASFFAKKEGLPARRTIGVHGSAPAVTNMESGA
jgi:hypothetical protein